MNNKLPLLILSVISIASLAVAIRTRQEALAYANQPNSIPNIAPIEEAQKQMRLIDAKLTNIAARLDNLENRPSVTPATGSASLDAVDANIETLLRTTSKNSQDVQKANQQLQTLVRNSQDAFNAVATQIQQLRGELNKLSEKNGTR